MMYLKINQDGSITYPYTIQQLKIDNPNVSFTDNISMETLFSYNVYSVSEVSFIRNYTKNYIEGIPNLIDNVYYQNWIIEDATVEQISERLNNQWNGMRSLRNEYLQQCDWTQLSDSPLSESKKSEWSIYRQALRDITLQEDPFNIVWPTKPE